MPDKLIGGIEAIYTGIAAALTFLGLGRWIATRQIGRIDAHDILHTAHTARMSELDKEIQKLDLKKLDEEKARQMVDAVHAKHNDMQYEFKCEMKEHRKEVNEKLDSIENLIRAMLSK